MKGKFFPLSIEAAEVLLLLTSYELREVIWAMFEYDYNGSEPDFLGREENTDFNNRVCQMCWLYMKKIAQEMR